MRTSILIAFLALMPVVLVAQTPAAAPQEEVKEKKVCRSETPTGSMMTLRTCHTKADWAAIDGQSRKDRQVVATAPSSVAQDALVVR